MNEPLIQGRQTIRAHLESGPVGAVLVWTPLQADVSRSRDLGYTFGTYELRIPGTNGPPTVRHGKYVSIWKRQADGSWKIVVDTGNPNPPPEGGLVPLPRE
jgi:ketosteroid isomerase-like protein